MVFEKRRDTMLEALRLEIRANSQILTALHPLEASSYLQAAVYCRDRLMHLPVLSARPTFSSERSYIAEGGRHLWDVVQHGSDESGNGVCTVVTVFL